MGIKDLKALIKKYSPDNMKEVQLADYSGRIIAIDASIFFYKFLVFDNLYNGIIRQALALLSRGITPLYVFDGKPPAAKADVIKDRAGRKKAAYQRKEDLEKLIAECEDPAQCQDLQKELFSVTQQTVSITEEHEKHARELLDLLGIPHLKTRGEAEVLCAKLCEDGHVYAVMTEDTDALPNGSLRTLMGFSSSADTVTEYDLSGILGDMKLTKAEFIDLCILCGCDYTTKIENVAKMQAYKHVQKHRRIEMIITCLKGKEHVPNDFNYVKARELFNITLDELLCEGVCLDTALELKAPNIAGLQSFMSKHCTSFAMKYYTEIDKKLAGYYTKIVAG